MYIHKKSKYRSIEFPIGTRQFKDHHIQYHRYGYRKITIGTKETSKQNGKASTQKTYRNTIANGITKTEEQISNSKYGNNRD